MTSENAPTICRRKLSDRRRISRTLIDKYHFGLGGRRQICRRAEDRANTYRDRYAARDVLLIAAIVALSSLDAFLTLALVENGAIEMNALMRSLIDEDVRAFALAKISLTSLSVLLLVIHRDFYLFRAIRVGSLLLLVLAFYSGLILYELSLLN